MDGEFVPSVLNVLLRDLPSLIETFLSFQAPEVLANQPYNEKADVYSYGIILWELLTRQCPYDKMTPIQCAIAVLNGNKRPEIPKWCPPSFQALIRTCWKKDPSERPTFPQILAALESVS
jgi:serine/threonine protein kinase